MKEPRRELPQIDAQFEFNGDPEYANELLDKLLRYYTLDEISLSTGVSRRFVSYLRQRGFDRFPTQLAFEVLAGVKRLDREVSI